MPSIELAGSVPTLCWSPDGDSLVFAYGLKEHAGLFAVAVHGGEIREIPLTEELKPYSLLDPTFSPDGERIAFTELSGSGSTLGRIWSAGADGADLVPVTDGGHADRQPRWAPGGRHLLFLSDRGGSSDVWWIELDRRRRPRSEPRPLTVGAGVGTLAVEPSGRSIVYSKVAERSSIEFVPLPVLDAVGLGVSESLFAENHLVEHFDLSPDSRFVAFDSNRSGNGDLWILEIASGELRQVTRGPEHDWHPSFSADGRRLVFHSLRGGQRDLHTIGVAGDAPHVLDPHSGKDWIPSASPTGDLVAFVSDRSGSPDIWVVSIDGGEPQRLTVHQGNDHNPIFSPDGRAVLFSSNRSGTDELYLVSLERGEPKRLSDHGWLDVIAFAWSPGAETLFAWGRKSGSENPARFWKIRFDDGAVRPLVGIDLGSRQPAPAMAADAENLYFLLWEREGICGARSWWKGTSLDGSRSFYCGTTGARIWCVGDRGPASRSSTPTPASRPLVRARARVGLLDVLHEYACGPPDWASPS